MRLPDFIKDEKKYKKWLYLKARSHHTRDKKYAKKYKIDFAYTYQEYKDAVNQSVIDSKGLDCYTGEMLDWSLIGVWDNEDARTIQDYKKQFKELPILEHIDRTSFASDFAICGWAVNDAKNDLSKDEFIKLCKKVIAHIG